MDNVIVLAEEGIDDFSGTYVVRDEKAICRVCIDTPNLFSEHAPGTRVARITHELIGLWYEEADGLIHADAGSLIELANGRMSKGANIWKNAEGGSVVVEKSFGDSPPGKLHRNGYAHSYARTFGKLCQASPRLAAFGHSHFRELEEILRIESEEAREYRRP